MSQPRVIVLCVIGFEEGTEYVASEFYCTQPGDTLANQVFDARLEDVLYERGITSSLWTGNNSPPRPVNELRFVNADGAISGWVDRAVRGIVVTLLTAFVEGNAPARSWVDIPFSAFTPAAVLKGNEIRADGEDYVVLSLRSWVDVFQEGTKGNDAPLVLGEVEHVRPYTTDAAGLVYVTAIPAYEELVTLRQKGVALIAPGDYVETSSGFDLTSPAEGLLQAHYKGVNYAGYWRETVPQCIHWLMTDGGDYDPITIDGSLASEIPAYAASYAQTGGRPIWQIMTDLLQSVNGFAWPHRDGNLHFGVLSLPSGTPVLEVTEDDLIGDLQWTADLAPGLTKSAQFNISAAPAQDSDIDPGAGSTDRAAALRRYDSASTATTFAGKYLPANLREPRKLYLRDAADAEAVLDDAAFMYEDTNAYFARFRMGVRDGVTAANNIEPNDVVRLTHSRYGLSGGQLGRVVWASSSLLEQQLELILWVVL